MNEKSRRGRKSSFYFWKLMGSRQRHSSFTPHCLGVSILTRCRAEPRRRNAPITTDHSPGARCLACLGWRQTAATQMGLAAVPAVMARCYPWRRLIESSGYQSRSSRANGAAFINIITPSVLASTREDILGPVNTLLCLGVFQGVGPQVKTEMSSVTRGQSYLHFPI